MLEIFLIFVAAKLFGQVAEWLRQPAIVGELVAGVVIGPAALGWIHLGEVQQTLAELGVVFLLFGVGLETRFSELRSVGKISSSVAALGVAIPFALGWGAMTVLNYDRAASLFTGTALVATSVGVTAAVLAAKGRLGGRAGRTVLGAAVIDDILGLVLLAVVSGTVVGTLDAGRVVATIVTAIGFVAFLAVAGTRFMRRFPEVLDRLLPDRSPLAVALIICLGLSALAAEIGLAAIIGAFMAGMVLAETRERYAFDRSLQPVNELLVPFFFVVTGAQIKLSAFSSARLVLLTGLLTLLAVVGKVAAGMIGARSLGRREALIVGVGMTPRGEVGVIVATLGLSSGTIGPSLYSVIVAVSVATTLFAAPLLSRLSEGLPDRNTPEKVR